MDFKHACAVLGLGSTPTLDQARAAYRLRAQMLHPDKHAGAIPEVRAEATRAMQQVGEAWAVLEATIQKQGVRETASSRATAAGAQQQAPPPPPPPRPPPTEPSFRRSPIVGECDFCGTAPAVNVELRRVAGWVVFFKTHRLEAELCRVCGLAMYRQTQARTLVTGWWGPLAALCNVWALFRNLSAKRKSCALGMLSSRSPDVVTPMNAPMSVGAPVVARPAPWLATLGAAATAVLLVAGSVAASGPTGWVGTCWTDANDPASCDSPDATQIVVSYFPTLAEASCYTPSRMEEVDDGYICVESNK